LGDGAIEGLLPKDGSISFHVCKIGEAETSILRVGSVVRNQNEAAWRSNQERRNTVEWNRGYRHDSHLGCEECMAPALVIGLYDIGSPHQKVNISSSNLNSCVND